MSLLEDLLGLPRKKEQLAEKKIIAQATASPTNALPLSIDEELEKSWDYVQKRLYCFELPFPKIVDSGITETACINMSSHEISIQKKFVDYLKGKGLDYQDIFKGLLLHEAGHYKIIPWDLKNMIMLTYRIEKVCPEKKNDLSNYFMDVCLNLELMLDKRESSIQKIYKVLGKDTKTEAVLSHLYAFKTGMDFDVPKISKELKGKVDELSKLKFTSRKRAYHNAERFAMILKDLADEDKKNQGDSQNGGNGSGSSGGSGGSAGSGSSGGSGGSGKNDDAAGKAIGDKSGSGRSSGGYSLSKVDDFNLGAYDEKEVERALKDIAREMEKPENYKKLYDFVRKEQERLRGQESGAEDDGPGANDDRANDAHKPGARKKGLPIPGSGWGRTPGRDPKDALIDFYNAKAENYEIHVEDKDVLGGGENANSELKPWEIDEPASKVDVFNSYGKYLPEISKAWNDAGSQGQKKIQGTPDLLVMIDSSCSMEDPAEGLSYAALGGICASRQYLRKGSKVSVVNFSSETKASKFMNDPRKVSKNILHYQDGGTRLELDKMHETLSRNKNSVDIMLISDGYIHNYDEAMRGLAMRKNTNRITVLEISSGFCFGGFSGDQGRFKHDKINIYTIRQESDLPGVVVGDLAKRGLI